MVPIRSVKFDSCGVISKSCHSSSAFVVFGVVSLRDPDFKTYILLFSPLGCIDSRRKIQASSSLNLLL